jgi:hypothetical protein
LPFHQTGAADVVDEVTASVADWVHGSDSMRRIGGNNYWKAAAPGASLRRERRSFGVFAFPAGRMTGANTSKRDRLASRRYGYGDGRAIFFEHF